MRRAATAIIINAAIISTTQALVSLANDHKNAASVNNATLNHCQSSTNQSQLAMKRAIREREIESDKITPSHMIISALRLNTSIIVNAIGPSHDDRKVLATQRAKSPQQIVENAN